MSLDYYRDYLNTVVSFAGWMTAQTGQYRDEPTEIQFVFNNPFHLSGTNQHETNLTNGSSERTRSSLDDDPYDPQIL